MNILLIEDNEALAVAIKTAFTEQRHEVEHTVDGERGLDLATRNTYNAIIVDRMLPGNIEGLSIIQRLRADGNGTPVLVLSALADVPDRIKGLKAGGDDYLTKPFAVDELLARVEVIARRTMSSTPPKLRIDDLLIDFRSHKVTRGEDVIVLRPREFRLLEYLMKHAGQVVTRGMLFEHVWNYDFDPETNVVDVQISKLRGKIDGPHRKPLIHTIRTVGYMLSADD